MKIENISRKTFIQSATALGGGLILGFQLPSYAGEPKKIRASMVSAWLRIDTEGNVTIMVPNSEMGQGVNTALPMIIAEELDADWSKVRSESAPHTQDFIHPGLKARFTGGSLSVRSWWPLIAKTGAAAREMLVVAAAARFQVPATELVTKKGMVIHKKSGQKAGYGSLAEEASKLTPPQEPKLKSKKDYTIVGKATKRLDTPDKVSGRTGFGIDVRLPDMLYATVRVSPTFVGKLTGKNEAAAKAIKGVKAIVPIERGVAVIADSYWHAKKGMEALDPRFDPADAAGLDSAKISKMYRQMLKETGIPVHKEGDTKKALSGAAKTFEAVYEVPFLAHATMEPMNTTAFFKGDSVEIWSPTQGESGASYSVSKRFNIPMDKITIHTTFLGGGFGRRFEPDVIVQAVEISKAVRAPVKTIWSREEDIQHDYYRPAGLTKFKVGLDKLGMPLALESQIVCPSISQRAWPANYKNGIDPTSVEGVDSLPYDIPNQFVAYLQKETSIPVGFWRSVGNSQNAFYVESLMDEIAQMGGHDPYEFRRKLLKKHPRHIVVLDKLAKKSGWKKPAPAGRFRGLAIHESFGSIVGQVVEISIGKDGEIRVHRVTCVIDCGRHVNPDTIRQQMESGVIFGLTAALKGKITIANGRVEQSNFHDYRMMYMAETPEIDVVIVENSENPGGVGEPGLPPSMPALTNAIFAATGKRIRSLPVGG